MSFLESKNVGCLLAFCMQDPDIEDYMPTIGEKVEDIVWVPRGTWRATPFLLLAARAAKIQFFWLVDDNVAELYAYAESQKKCSLSAEQLSKWLQRAQDDCSKTGAVACCTGSTQKGLYVRHKTEERDDGFTTARERSFEKLLHFSSDCGLLYGAWTGFNTEAFIKHRCGAQPGSVLFPSACRGRNALDDTEMTARAYMTGAHWLRYVGLVVRKKPNAKGGQSKLFKNNKAKKQSKVDNEKRILKWCWRHRNAYGARWQAFATWWNRNSFLTLDSSNAHMY